MSKKASNTAIVKRSAVVQEQQKAISQMKPALRKVYTKMRENRVDMYGTSLHYYYSLGQDVEAATADVNVYGAGAVKLLAIALDIDVNLLDKSAAFARSYDDQEFKALLGLRTTTNDGLTWTHVMQLVVLKDHKQRSRLQEQAARMNWTGEELRQAITEHLGEKEKPQTPERRGRKVVKPKTTMQGLKSFCVGAGEYVRRATSVWDEFFEEAYQVPPDTVDTAAMTQAERVVQMAMEANKVAQAQLEAATKVRDRFKDIIKTRDGDKELKTADEDQEDEE